MPIRPFNSDREADNGNYAARIGTNINTRTNPASVLRRLNDKRIRMRGARFRPVLSQRNKIGNVPSHCLAQDPHFAD